jgi:hypothetical protein
LAGAGGLIAKASQVRAVEQASDATVERRLLEQPADIRDAARALSREFALQSEELRDFKPNDPDRIAQRDNLLALFEKMATGLANLADALDQAVSKATNGKPEPVFLGEAGKIARQLHFGLMEWLEDNRTMVIEVPIRITLFGLCVALLHSLGADSTAAIAGLTTLLLRGEKKKKQRK